MEVNKESKNRKLVYEKPLCEIIFLDCEDVIVTSTNVPDDGKGGNTDGSGWDIDFG